MASLVGILVGMVLGMTLLGGLLGWVLWLFAKTPQPAADILGLIFTAVISGYTNAASFGGSVLMTILAYSAAGVVALLMLQLWHRRDERSKE